MEASRSASTPSWPPSGTAPAGTVGTAPPRTVTTAPALLRRHHHVRTAWVEPLDAYRILRRRGALLLDGMGAHPEARHAFLALTPRMEARLVDDRLHITHEDGSRVERRGEPVGMLRDLLAPWRFDVDEGTFTGGWVGYFAYEFARAVEPTLPVAKNASSPPVPDDRHAPSASPSVKTGAAPSSPHAVLRLCRDAVVFDRTARTVTVWTTDLPGESGASARLDDIVADLARPAPPRAAPARPLPAPGAAVVPAPAVAPAVATPATPSSQFPPGPQATPWRTSMDEAAFCDAVTALKERIRTGDLFQANLATRFSAPLAPGTDPAALFAALCQSNPSPFMALMEWGDHAIVSGSPEQLLCVEDGRIRSRPIAGTRPRGATPEVDAAMEEELLRDDKEQAEHTMLVDLVRNDIAKVAVPGTVRVAERMSVERYSHVMHLASRVEADVRPGTDFVDCLAALFPGGTISGAPKHRACVRIHEAEPVPRGPYTGSAGYLSWSGRAQWNILIRTLVLAGREVHVHAGSGIVMDSDPAREWREARAKAQALLDAAMGGAQGVRVPAPPDAATGGAPGAGVPAPPHAASGVGTFASTTGTGAVHSGVGTLAGAAGIGGDAGGTGVGAARGGARAGAGAGRPDATAAPDRLGEVTRHGDWSPPTPPRRIAARVLLVDNYDSFVWNLADYCAALGAEVRVVRNDADWRAAARKLRPTHAILGPGPGWPSEAGCTKELIQAFFGKVPLLGVCLGHQAIAEAAGARIVVAPEAVHGKTSPVFHDGHGLLAGRPSPLQATRYHSLVVEPGTLPAEWVVDACLADGTVMGFRHRAHPIFGVQYHPESLCTQAGLETVLRFLET